MRYRINLKANVYQSKYKLSINLEFVKNNFTIYSTQTQARFDRPNRLHIQLCEAIPKGKYDLVEPSA